MTHATASVPRQATQVMAFSNGHWMTEFKPYERNKALKVATCETCGAKVILDTNGNVFAGVAHKSPCPNPKRKAPAHVAL